MALKLITPPTIRPLSLAEIKAHLRVDHSDEDALIEIYYAAVLAYIEGAGGWLGRALDPQTWELSRSSFPTGAALTISIPLPPLQSVESVKYVSGGEELTLDPSRYTVDTASEPGMICPDNVWPSGSDVKIRFVAGWPASTDSPPQSTVPAAIKSAILLRIGDLYAHREAQVQGATSELGWAAEALLRRYRIDLSLA